MAHVLRRDARLLRPAVPERPRVGLGAVPRCRGADADLRGHARRQLRPRLAVHAGRLPRVVARRGLRRRRLRALGERRRRGPAGGRARRPDRVRAAEAPVRCTRAPAAHRDVRHRARGARRDARDLGCRGPARAARAVARRDARHRRARDPRVRPVPHRRRAAGARCTHLARHPHALRHAGARRIGEPRARRCARRASGRALHGRVRAGGVPRRARRCVAAAARAGEPEHGPGGRGGSVRGHGGWRPGLDPRSIRGGIADRSHQGAVHRAGNRRGRRHRDRLPAHDPGRRVRRHGGSAGRQAARPPRPALGPPADHAAAGAARARPPAGTPRGARRCRTAFAAAVDAAVERRLHAGARHGRTDRRAVRGEPAVHPRAWRHDELRARRLVRHWRLRRGARLQARLADARRTRDRARRSDGGGRAARCVRGASRRRLPRDAHARLRADRLVDRVPVGRCHRRQQRAGRHLAARDARRTFALLPVHAGGRRGGAVRARAGRRLPVRLRAARHARLAAARRGGRHRRPRDAVARVCAGGCLRRARRRPLRVLEGQHLAGDPRDPALGRRVGDGAPRRAERPVRPADRRGRVHLDAGRPCPQHRLLARGRRRADPAHRAAVPARRRRRVRSPVAQGRLAGGA